MNFIKLYFALSLICLIVGVAPAHSATIHVPADQPTIQAGIDAAITGDTVLVADGTYTGPGNRDIDFGGKGVVLKSENGAEYTIIDCEGSSTSQHRGFNFHSGEDTTTVVQGFTISNGYQLVCGQELCDGLGGGIACVDNSSPTIINNTISGNTAADGGGIGCSNSNPTISNNTISGNSAGFLLGGGIYCVDNSSPTISNNTISGNSATFGGGIYCEFNSNPTINNNTINGNSANLGGGGIFCFFSNPSISNNTISGNSANIGGGGIYCDNSNPTISNNTISGNSGGGLYLESNSSPSLVNTIIAFNTGGPGVICSPSNPTTLTCCDVYGNEGGDWVGCIADQLGTNGNFSADPLFCGTVVGDYHLNVFSPCAAGQNSCGVLIGALDIRCGLGFLCADANGDLLVNVDDVEFLLNFYFYGGATPFPYLASDLNCDGSVNIADITYLAAYINGTGAPPCCEQ